MKTDKTCKDEALDVSPELPEDEKRLLEYCKQLLEQNPHETTLDIRELL